MNNRITILLQENLPMPLIHFASPEGWAAWYLSQLEHSLAQGNTAPAISVCSGGVGRNGIGTVLLSVQEFLLTHPGSGHLRILCGDEAMFLACCSCWNSLQDGCAVPL